MKRQKPRRRKALRVLLCLLLALLLLATGGAVLLIAPYTGARMDMSLLDIPAVSEPARLLAYDPADRVSRSGALHTAPGAPLAPPERRIFVPYDDLPADLIHAFIAIEDKRFYRHSGVDLRRTAAAGIHYLLGHPSFGGSTITQQLIKNLTGEDDATPDRKLTEIFRALDLERNADKQSILEAYLNIINLSGGCRGVGAAAKRYYDKPAAALTLPECATVAAITNNPARYDPLTHPAENRERRDLILREMAAQGYITPEARDAAIATDLNLSPGAFAEPAGPQAIPSWYADMVAADVIRDLCDRLGYTRTVASRLLYSGGLVVECAMDEELQALVESYYADPTHFPVGDDGRPQSSFILIDPATGDILAVAGAVGEKTASRLQSYATDTRRPAGSCLKPLSVYAPALASGKITWATLLDDSPVTDQDGTPWPRNADGLYRGPVTVGEAVAESVNTVAVRLLEEVGLETSFAFLHDRLGMHSLISPTESVAHDLTLSSLALGQQSRGVTSRELTAAYTALYDGRYRPPVSYHRVLDKEGKVLLENPPASEEILSPSNAALLTKLLEGVTAHGTAARYLTLSDTLGIACAGKTGTTQNNCDRRFVGYTPRLLAGVWMGYDYPSELRGIPGNPCVGIWDDLMTACERAYRGAPPKADFDTPDDLVELDFCPLSGCLPTDWCTDPAHGIPPEHGWFLAGTEPHAACTLHDEPPIDILPTDPADPDRIPLLPGDALHEPLPVRPESPTDDRPWFSRWFTRFSRGERKPKL